jgi:hypothetical protein
MFLQFIYNNGAINNKMNDTIIFNKFDKTILRDITAVNN